MAFPLVVNAFTSGEISPSLYARTDIEGYQRGAALLYNVFVDYHGGAINRAGTQFIGKAQSLAFGYGQEQQDYFPRLIPFVFEQDQSMVIVFEHLQVRFLWKGGFIVEDAKVITGITKANPGVVTSTAHGYVNGNLIFINEVGGMNEVNGRYFTVSAVTPNTFQLQDIFTGVTVNTSGFTAYTAGGKAYRVYTVTSPYSALDVWTLKFVQSRDVMTLVSPRYAPYHLTRYGNTDWRFELITFASKTAKPTGVALDPSMTGTGTEYSYVVTATNKDSGEESEPSAVNTINRGFWTVDDSVRVTWSDVTGADFYTIYRASVVKNRSVHTKAIYGQIGQSRGLGFNDGHETVDWELTPPTNNTPFVGADNYPSCVTYVQQRAAYGASVNFPYRLWMSPTGSFDSMNKSLPPRDIDALQFDLASTRADPILNMLAMPAGVLCLTSGGIYHVYGGGEGEPITPSNVNIDLVSSISASFLAPISVDLNVLLTQAKGSTVQNVLYNFNQSLYESFDLSILSSHFFANESIVSWSYANEPHKVVWAVRSDGRLLSMTYLAEQKIYAWALHETEGFIKDVCAIPEEHEDVLYLVVDRPRLGITCFERLVSRVITNAEDCWFVDSAQSSFVNRIDAPLQVNQASGTGVTAIALDGTTPFAAGDVGKVIRGGGGMMEIASFISNTTITVNILRPITNVYPSGIPYIFRPIHWSMDAKFSTFQGLYHLEGKQVVGLADGAVIGPLTVTNGVIALDNPCSRLILGLWYGSKIQTLPIEFSTRDFATAQSKRKNVEAVTVKVVNSRGVLVGPNFEDMENWPSRTDEWLGQPPDLVTSGMRIQIDGGWNDTGQVCFAQNLPLPMQISGLVLDMDIGDS